MNEHAIRDGVRGFNVRRQQAGDAAVDVLECAAGTLVLTFGDVRVDLRWPLDAESVWFVLEPEWVASVVNEQTLSGRISTLQPLLAHICEVVDRAAQPAGSDESGSLGSLSQSAHSLGASSTGLELSLSGSFDMRDGRNFHLSASEFMQLSAQVEQAQDVLGTDRVKLVHELGAVKMCIDAYELFDAEVAEKLGFHADDPVFLSFSYERSAVPLVTCTQLREPGFGVRYHLKTIIEHFFHCWAKDRSALALRGRPPKELTDQFGGAAKTGAASPVADVRNNNNKPAAAAAARVQPPPPPPPAKAAAVEKPKKQWWKGLRFGRLSRSKSSSESVTVKGAPPPPPSPPEGPATPLQAELRQLRELGFDDVACVRALLANGGSVERATRALLDDPALQSTPAQLQQYGLLRGMGFATPVCVAALLKSEFNVEAASLLCLEPDALMADATAPSQQPELKRTKTEPIGEEERPPADMPEDNVIFALMSYLQERLGHYCSYCVSCQAPHSCFNPSGGVVCCKPLCVFQLEGSQLESLVNVRQCPFADCHNLDLTLVGRDFMGMPLQQLCSDYGISPIQLLEMMLHRYLPAPEMKKFLNDGLKVAKQSGGGKTPVVTTVLNPALCARFEHGWKQLREKRPDMNIQPAVAYHGTSDAGIDGITGAGFLLNKLGSNTRNQGVYGAGIYCSQNVTTAMAYARGSRMIVCAVLMGKIYKCNHNSGPMLGVPVKPGFDSHEDPSGQEWVVFDEAYILPCYVVQFR